PRAESQAHRSRRLSRRRRSRLRGGGTAARKCVDHDNRGGSRGGAVVVTDGVLEAVVVAGAGGGGGGGRAGGRIDRDAAVLRSGDHGHAGGHQVLVAVGIGVVFQHIDGHRLSALGLAEVVSRRRDVDADKGRGDARGTDLVIADTVQET